MLFASKCTVLLNVGETQLLGTLPCGAQSIIKTMQDQCSQQAAASVGVDRSPFTSISREDIISSQTFFSDVFCSLSVEEKCLHL